MRSQDSLDVIQDLLGLCAQVADTDDCALFVRRDLSGNEKQRSAVDAKAV